MHLPVASLLPVRDVEHILGRIDLLVGQGPTRHQRHVTVSEVRPVHAERCEDALLREVLQVLAGRAFDDDRHQKVARVAVEPLAARGKVQVALADDCGERVGVVGHVVGAETAQDHQADVIAEAAGVTNQLVDRNWSARVLRQFRNELSNVIGQSELAVLSQEQDAGGGKLLRGRAQVEHGLRSDRHIPLEVRHPVTFGKPDLAVLVHRHRASGRGGPIERPERGVDSCYLRISEVIAAAGACDGAEQRETKGNGDDDRA